MKIPSDSYWTLEKNFQLMDIAQGWIKYVIGNGNSTFMWHDNWHPLGPLSRHYGRKVVFKLRRSLDAQLCSIIDEGGRKCPGARNPLIQETRDNTPVDFKTAVHKVDEVRRLLTGNGVYSSRSVWEAVRTTSCLVRWYKVAGFQQCVPRWVVILWMACHVRLGTKDKLANWGTVNNTFCVLYDGAN